MKVWIILRCEVVKSINLKTNDCVECQLIRYWNGIRFTPRQDSVYLYFSKSNAMSRCNLLVNQGVSCEVVQITCPSTEISNTK